MPTLLPPVLQRMQALGYAVFTGGDYNLNLFGIRSRDATSGSWNDLLGCAYRVAGEWQVQYWAATTDPGLYYREHPMRVDGTAILVPGQYRGAYAVGLHAGRYRALVQTAGPVCVWRDADQDTVLDMGPDVPMEVGYFGINIHASANDPYSSTVDRDVSSDVGKWSAGCQVHATTTGFRAMMDLVDAQIRTHPTWPQTFTYTLLEQWE